MIIRGSADCDYHADILKKFNCGELQDETILAACPGGGRVNINYEAKTLFIYGYS